MSKPIIGIIEWPYTDKDGDLIYEVSTPIIEMVARSGGIPIGIFPTQLVDYVNTRLNEIPPLTSTEKYDIIKILSMCSAIIKPGALKIYNYERFIYEYVLEKDIPYLGICAGMQLMSHYGKENIRNVRNEENSGVNHFNNTETYAHRIKILPNTILSTILNKDSIMVNSRHKYHIPDAGVNKVSAYSEDGVIEGIENPNTRFQLGIQWHPELLPNDENSKIILNGLVEAAQGQDFRLIKKIR